MTDEKIEAAKEAIGESRAAVPNLFGASGWGAYENLIPDDLRWS